MEKLDLVYVESLNGNIRIMIYKHVSPKSPFFQEWSKEKIGWKFYIFLPYVNLLLL